LKYLGSDDVDTNDGTYSNPRNTFQLYNSGGLSSEEDWQDGTEAIAKSDRGCHRNILIIEGPVITTLGIFFNGITVTTVEIYLEAPRKF
jgi:hypothetical protein